MEALFLRGIRVLSSLDQSLRLLILPNGINLSYVANEIIANTAIHQIAEIAVVTYERDNNNNMPIKSGCRVSQQMTNSQYGRSAIPRTLLQPIHHSKTNT